MGIQDEIKELRNKLDELEKQVKEKKITGRYIPERSQTYYCVNSFGIIIKETNTQVNMDKYKISIGNCFRTEEEAEKHKRILINTQKLKDLAERLNNGQDIDWGNSCQLKYFIKLSNGLCLDGKWVVRHQGTIYCLNKSFLTKAIEEIGEEALIELIKGE